MIFRLQPLRSYIKLMITLQLVQFRLRAANSVACPELAFLRRKGRSRWKSRGALQINKYFTPVSSATGLSSIDSFIFRSNPKEHRRPKLCPSSLAVPLHVPACSCTLLHASARLWPKLALRMRNPPNAPMLQHDHSRSAGTKAKCSSM